MLSLVKKVKGSPVVKYGARYGSTLRKRAMEVELRAKDTYSCPECKQKRVKRVAVGIWECKKCGLKFAGAAYSPEPGQLTS